MHVLRLVTLALSNLARQGKGNLARAVYGALCVSRQEPRNGASVSNLDLRYCGCV